MAELIRLNAQEANREAILQAIDRDGALILEGAMSATSVDSLLREIEPFVAGTVPFDDDFVGRQTTRTGGLVTRSKTAREAVMHEVVVDAATGFLTRHSDNIQLNLTQIMRLMPGQDAQALHRDRYLWSQALPREIEPQFNTMWALTEFTEENGATRVVPGSQTWDWDRPLDCEGSIPAEMPLGSALLYTGSVVHGGGANGSNAPRIGMNITYLLGWLRQEENQYLSCPPDIARELDPALQEMLGYTVGNNSLGYYSPPEASKGHIDTLPPEAALGRMPRAAEREQQIF